MRGGTAGSSWPRRLYAFGACLCLINTYVSIGFIVLVQLYFALGLRLPYLQQV